MRILFALVLTVVAESLASACPDGTQLYRRFKDDEPVCIDNSTVNYIKCVSDTTGGEREIKIEESSKSPPGLLSASIKGIGSIIFHLNQYKDFVRKVEKKLDPSVADTCRELSRGPKTQRQEPKVEKQKTTITESGYSHTKETDGHSHNFNVVAQCPDDFPNLVRCQDWSAVGNTGGEDPFSMEAGDRARKRQDRASNQCVCAAHHDSQKLGGPGHWIKCSVTAVCSE